MQAVERLPRPAAAGLAPQAVADSATLWEAMRDEAAAKAAEEPILGSICRDAEDVP